MMENIKSRLLVLFVMFYLTYAKSQGDLTHKIKSVKNLKDTEAQLRKLSMIGMLFGAVKSEFEMENKMNSLMDDLKRNFHKMSDDIKRSKIKNLEKIMTRNDVSITILSDAINLATKNMTYDQYNRDLQKLAHVIII